MLKQLYGSAVVNVEYHTFEHFLLIMLVFPIFENMILCKTVCHSFVKAFVGIYSVKCGMSTFENMLTKYVGMPYTYRYFICKSVCHSFVIAILGFYSV